MEASQDNLSLFHEEANAFHTAKDQKRKYLSHRVFMFMKGVPELKYETKDEDSLKKLKFHD